MFELALHLARNPYTGYQLAGLPTKGRQKDDDMSTIPMWQDDRTPEQLTTHTTLIAGRDIFLGSWGPAKANGGSTAIWACTPENALKVLAWVENRSDMRYVRNITERNARRLAGMVHIYTIEEGHPALSH